MAYQRTRYLALLLALCLTAIGLRSAWAGDDQKLNINTASVEQLMTLHGIGEVTAKAIVAHRQEHGPFKSVEDLVAVSGIGEKRLSTFRDQITVGGAGGGTAKGKPSS